MLETADKIRKAREFLGETREKFAARFGVTAREVGYWETGERTPHPAVLKLLDPMLRKAILGNGG